MLTCHSLVAQLAYRVGDLIVPANINKDEFASELEFFELKPPSDGDNENASDEGDHGGEPADDEDLDESDEEANEPTNDATGSSPQESAEPAVPAKAPLIQRWRTGVSNIQSEDRNKWETGLYQLLVIWNEVANQRLTGEESLITRDCRYFIALAYYKYKNTPTTSICTLTSTCLDWEM